MKYIHRAQWIITIQISLDKINWINISTEGCYMFFSFISRLYLVKECLANDCDRHKHTVIIQMIAVWASISTRIHTQMFDKCRPGNYCNICYLFFRILQQQQKNKRSINISFIFHNETCPFYMIMVIFLSHTRILKSVYMIFIRLLL